MCKAAIQPANSKPLTDIRYQKRIDSELNAEINCGYKAEGSKWKDDRGLKTKNWFADQFFVHKDVGGSV
ncbi:hypothetical protein C8P68_104179 [Mucilaginibacter yixingensis]|uniref:Uncharacterized protein n=1 Tax=Mucilaginibacter yixingensis TaxID=1295612 RepID=A0A2T5J9D7_9SPHI|nr:hypothetical protein C8P68_104179 [Mucilaginibacter yixingensis]